MTEPALGRQRLALVALCLGFFVVLLDATVVNVALEAIRADVGGTLGDQQWIVDSYTLVLAAGMLGAGSAGDRFGPRRVYLVGLLVFALASVGCALAPGIGALVVARAVQGAGAAALLPCSLALIVRQFPHPMQRAHALGVWGGVSGIGLASGPALGALLLATVGWRAIFLLNVPVCAVAAVLLWAFVTEGDRRAVGRFDLAGLVLGTASLGCLTAGLIELGQRAAGAVPLLVLSGGCLLFGLFVLVEARHPAPMVPVGMFRRPAFSPAVTVGFLFNFCLYGALLCVSLVFQAYLRLPAFQAGLLVLPMTVTVAVGAALSGRLTARYGPRRPMMLGYCCGVAGSVVTAVGGTAGSLPVMVAGATLLGFCSFAMPAMTSVVMAAADPERPALASGVLNSARQTGGALGVAALGALLAASGPTTAALVPPLAAVVVAYGVAAACTLVATRQARPAAVTASTRRGSGA
ncbi:MFS transporter [Pseudonocardia acaciae]|uniref:MFS transporter n=1 Tax=Pseudonocardia acaciae TaxID=551276 RepID=UPI00048DBA41|nr:MFS transporter [Pseudonocardia acaciae]